jgi:selenide,water dikinase
VDEKKEEVLVGFSAGDDGGVYRISPESALVATVDVIAPVVDDPYIFGGIAAANALSDVYAMGGEPLFALCFIAYPKKEVAEDDVKRMLEGGIAKLNEADVSLIGGHSVADPEVKLGYAVTGKVHPERLLRISGAKPGDLLILTKRLGLGVITTAIKKGRAPRRVAEAAISEMLTLNREAGRLMRRFFPNGASDITGFGFLGHLVTMAEKSGVSAEVFFDEMPFLPGLLPLARRKIFPAMVSDNQRFVGNKVSFSPDVTGLERTLLFDPQTSGGLLISLPEERARLLFSELRKSGVPAAICGRVIEKSTEFIISVERKGLA